MHYGAFLCSNKSRARYCNQKDLKSDQSECQSISEHIYKKAPGNYECARRSNFSIMRMASSTCGKRCVPSHDPTAISALKVCEAMLCCMKLTSQRPSENDRSASVDDAA